MPVRHSNLPPVLYIAGPYSAPNSWLRECNVRRAEALALALTAAGFACVCVHTSSRYAHGCAPEEVFVRADMALVRRSDVVVTSWGSERSTGTRDEARMAGEWGIPVESVEPGAIDLLRRLCDRLGLHDYHDRAAAMVASQTLEWSELGLKTEERAHVE